MTSYALDTNACIALINGRAPEVRKRFNQLHAAGEPLMVSSVVLFELRYGAEKSRSPAAANERVDVFIGGPLDIIPFDQDDASEAGVVRAELERQGRPIGAYDLLIAGQARHRGLTLVTANVSEFARVEGLAVEDWAR